MRTILIDNAIYLYFAFYHSIFSFPQSHIKFRCTTTIYHALVHYNIAYFPDFPIILSQEVVNAPINPIFY